MRQLDPDVARRAARRSRSVRFTDRPTFRSLRFRNNRLWLIGQSSSSIGFFVQTIAQVLVVLEISGSGAALGFVVAVQYVPILVVGPWSGVLSDRVDKRRFMFCTQIATLACAISLGVLVLGGYATLPAVMILTVVSGTAFAFEQPPRRTIVTELVPDEDAPNAVSLNGAVGNVSKIIGPALAALIAATLDVGWCFILNAVASLTCLMLLLMMRPEEMRRPPLLARSPGQIRDGIRYVLADRDACAQLAMIGIVTIIAFNWNVLLPLLVTGDLGGSDGSYAIVLAVMSVGSLGGSLYMARRHSADVPFLARASVLLGVLLLVLAMSPTLVFATAAAMAVGATMMVLWNGSIVMLQLRAAPAMRGRVMAVFSMVFLGSNGLGSPFAGMLAEAAGTRFAFAFGGVGAILTGGATALLARRHRHVPRVRRSPRREALDRPP